MSRVFKNKGNVITQAFKKRVHNGIDLVGTGYTLDYITAHSEGTVVAVRNNYKTNDKTGCSYGNYVKIKHNGYYTLYAHMKYNSVTVRVGQKVSKGQVIGYMGNTGHSFGAHLHFEVRDKNDNFINPTPYINADLPVNNSVEPDYTGVITYQAYTDQWLPEVKKCDNTDEGYAGIYGKAISGLRCKPEYGEITVQAHIKNGSWLDKVNSKNYKKNDRSNPNSYSGIYGKPIDCVKIKSTKGHVTYRVKTAEDGWLPYVDSRTEQGTESYAGIYGHTIIGIQMK
jgi:Membrane proteins related to metalloendopeptidases